MYMLFNTDLNQKPVWQNNNVDDFLELYRVTTSSPNKQLVLYGRCINDGELRYAQPRLPGMIFEISSLTIKDTLSYTGDNIVEYQSHEYGGSEMTKMAINLNDYISGKQFSLIKLDSSENTLMNLVAFGTDGTKVWLTFSTSAVLTGKYYIGGYGLFEQKLGSIFSWLIGDNRPINIVTTSTEVGRLKVEPYEEGFSFAMDFSTPTETGKLYQCILMDSKDS